MLNAYYDYHDAQAALAEAAAVEAADAPFFPDALAIDPEDCGCTECIIGEYINENRFAAFATKGDLIRVVTGDIKFHFDTTAAEFIFNRTHETASARDFVRELQEQAIANYAV